MRSSARRCLISPRFGFITLTYLNIKESHSKREFIVNGHTEVRTHAALRSNKSPGGNNLKLSVCALRIQAQASKTEGSSVSHTYKI